jgi:hypothetical protein
MKRNAIVICAVLLAAGFLLWLLHGHHPEEMTPPDMTENAGSQSSAVHDGNVPRKASDAVREGTPDTSAAPGPRAASPLTVSNSLSQEMLAEWQAPIDFYGKVLDENTNAVAGASVRFTWTETPEENGERTSETESDSQGLFSLRGKRGSTLQVWVDKQGYYAPKPGFRSFTYSLSAHFLPDAVNPIVFPLRKKGTPEPLLCVGGTGLSAMRDYLLSRDGDPTEVSLRDGKQVSVGEGDLQVEVWIGKPLQGFPSRLEWRCRLAVPGGGLIEAKDEYPFTAPMEGYHQSDEWTIDAKNWSERVQKQYYVLLRDGNYGLVTLRVLGVANPFFRLASLVNPSGSRNLEPPN